MPYLSINNKNIYYREYGSGEKVVFLNGLMMSTSSWAPFINIFSREFKMILVDLIDQGRSDSGDSEYLIDSNVEILKKFLKLKGYDSVHIVGISYGGQIGQLFTLKYPHMVKSLVLLNTTSQVDKNIAQLKDSWGQAISTEDPLVIFNTFVKSMYSRKFYENNIEWFNKNEIQFVKLFNTKWSERLNRAIISGYGFNVLHEIHQIVVPTLIISSEYDTITPQEYQLNLYKKITNSKWVLIKDAGHACIYEKPYEFATLLVGFIKTCNLNITI